jgi:hypothetical protein
MCRMALLYEPTVKSTRGKFTDPERQPAFACRLTVTPNVRGRGLPVAPLTKIYRRVRQSHRLPVVGQDILVVV